MKLRLTAAFVLTLVAIGSTAEAAKLRTGNSMAWVGFNGNVAQLSGPTTDPLNAPGASIFEAGELGLHLAYSYFISDKWTIVFSGGFDVGKQQFEPTGGNEVKLSINSWNMRFGMDRFAFITDDVAIYAGPGILYWTGSAEVDGTGDPDLDIEWPETKQWGLNGRAGMWARLGPRYALFGHIGQVIATNSADDDHGKASWWSSHHEGTVGLSVDF